MIHKGIYHIKYSHSDLNETVFIGKDEFDNSFTLTMRTIELLEWIDIEDLKEESNKYIKSLQQ